MVVELFEVASNVECNKKNEVSTGCAKTLRVQDGRDKRNQLSRK